MSNKQTLEALRSQFSKPSGNDRENLPNNYYPFWNMEDGQQCKIRFVPDLNQDNPFGFLVQKVMHTLEIDGEKKSVPCLSMYGKECPICKVSSDFYKNKDEVNGKKYWKKRQYIGQALVVEDPLNPDATTGEKHTGKFRYVALGFQIYKIIEESFKSDEILESIPYNFEDGYDFIIKKTSQGKYATYTSGTTFARKQRALSEDELVIVEDGMIDLASLLPKEPELDKIEAMLRSALHGGSYSEDDVPTPPRRQSPAASNNDDDDPMSFVQSPAPAASASSSDDEPVQGNINDTLARIRQRRIEKEQSGQ